MVDKVKVAVLERNGNELDYQEESGNDDQIKSGGLYSENTLNFSDSEVPTNTTLKKLDDGAGFGIAGRYALVLQHNGTVGNGTFFGYSNLINGLDTPIVIPRNSTLKDLSFSNANASADFTIYLRKNSSTATPFYTITKTNSDNFTEIDINELFSAGDLIYLEYQDNGTNASDVGIVLFFRNEA